jgi:predicted DNA-binding transcriptional regulator YafY
MVARTHGTAEERTYRIDRILAATMLDTHFAPFSAEMPEWFDLESHEHVLRLRLAPADLKRVPPPARVSDTVHLDDGRVEATVTVIGEHRLADVLLLLGADAEIVDAPELVAMRTRHAADVLARYARGP